MKKIDGWELSKRLLSMSEQEIKRVFGSGYKAASDVVAKMKLSEAVDKYNEYYKQEGIIAGDYYTDGKFAVVVTLHSGDLIYYLREDGFAGHMMVDDFLKEYTYMNMYTNFKETTLRGIKNMHDIISKAS